MGYATLPPDASLQEGGTSWGVAAFMAVGGLVIGAGAALILAPADRPEVAVASAPPPPPPAPSASAAPPKVLTPVEKAAAGDAEAMAAIAAKTIEQRSVEESIALGRGRSAEKVTGVLKLGKTLEKNPEFGNDPEMHKRLRELANDPEVAVEALFITSKLQGTGGPDVFYDVWTGTRKKTVATELAQSLLFSKDVRAKASDALSVALDLRTTTDCEEMKAVLERAKEHADRRSIRSLGKLNLKFGCGEKKNEDCWKCFRTTHLLKDAIKTSTKNPAPRLR